MTIMSEELLRTPVFPRLLYHRVQDERLAADPDIGGPPLEALPTGGGEERGPTSATSA
jgi:hypothetical protein